MIQSILKRKKNKLIATLILYLKVENLMLKAVTQEV